mmetsp:Transcript_13194/g.33717  ORF Transcript_13194/g.33717 Transcript_13194/m.33717 type:complete len:232 (-) Transcript_13194:27-722(-)
MKQLARSLTMVVMASREHAEKSRLLGWNPLTEMAYMMNVPPSESPGVHTGSLSSSCCAPKPCPISWAVTSSRISVGTWFPLLTAVVYAVLKKRELVGHPKPAQIPAQSRPHELGGPAMQSGFDDGTHAKPWTPPAMAYAVKRCTRQNSSCLSVEMIPLSDSRFSSACRSHDATAVLIRKGSAWASTKTTAFWTATPYVAPLKSAARKRALAYSIETRMLLIVVATFDPSWP